MIELNSQNFKETLKSADKPVLVDFFAEWCTPCHMLAPVLENISKDYEDKIVFSKLNIDLAADIASEYDINQIPAVMVFKAGEPVSGFIGLHPEDFLRDWLDSVLSGNDNPEVNGLIEEYEAYAKEKGFQLNPDRELVERTVQGILKNEREKGKRYCPCRKLSGTEEEDEKKICPCAFHEKEIEEQGHCCCFLFVKR